MKRYSVLIILLFLFSCGSSTKNPCDVFIGKWTSPSSNNTLVIKSNGPTYTVDFVYEKSFNYDHPRNSQAVATCENGILKIVTPQNATIIYYKNENCIKIDASGPYFKD